MLLAISRIRPNNDVATKHNKTSDTQCRNKCYGKVFHLLFYLENNGYHQGLLLDNKPSFLVGGGAIGPPNIPDDLGI